MTAVDLRRIGHQLGRVASYVSLGRRAYGVGGRAVRAVLPASEVDPSVTRHTQEESKPGFFKRVQTLYKKATRSGDPIDGANSPVGMPSDTVFSPGLDDIFGGIGVGLELIGEVLTLRAVGKSVDSLNKRRKQRRELRDQRIQECKELKDEIIQNFSHLYIKGNIQDVQDVKQLREFRKANELVSSDQTNSSRKQLVERLNLLETKMAEAKAIARVYADVDDAFKGRAGAMAMNVANVSVWMPMKIYRSLLELGAVSATALQHVTPVMNLVSLSVLTPIALVISACGFRRSFKKYKKTVYRQAQALAALDAVDPVLSSQFSKKGGKDFTVLGNAVGSHDARTRFAAFAVRKTQAKKEKHQDEFVSHGLAAVSLTLGTITIATGIGAVAAGAIGLASLAIEMGVKGRRYLRRQKRTREMVSARREALGGKTGLIDEYHKQRIELRQLEKKELAIRSELETLNKKLDATPEQGFRGRLSNLRQSRELMATRREELSEALEEIASDKESQEQRLKLLKKDIDDQKLVASYYDSSKDVKEFVIETLKEERAKRSTDNPLPTMDTQVIGKKRMEIQKKQREMSKLSINTPEWGQKATELEALRVEFNRMAEPLKQETGLSLIIAEVVMCRSSSYQTLTTEEVIDMFLQDPDYYWNKAFAM